MLNEVPNNNEVVGVANIMLNEVSKNNDAMHVLNNVLLTTMSTQQFSVAAI